MALIPFLLLYLAHFTMCPLPGTGFILWDMPYYCANGREIFQRGNGLMYCNPYDPDPDTPVIYFHWLTWVMGFGIVKAGFDPGIWFMTIGIVAATLTAFITFRIVEEVLPSPHFLVLNYFLAMWGGGVLVCAGFFSNIIFGRAAFEELLRFDPFDGWWFLSWGRNLVLPNEAVYHMLVSLTWLAVLRDRYWIATAATTALAATHPFSGIQHLVILGGWFAYESIHDRRVRPCVVVLVAVMISFLGYYFLFLPSFPQHRDIHTRWSLHWNLPVASLVAAYGPVALIAIVRWRCNRLGLPRHLSFFATAAIVSLMLARHDLIFPSQQPLHFTRGYIWFPLFIMATPFIQFAATAAQHQLGRFALPVVISLASFSCLDNATWILSTTVGPLRRQIEVGLSHPVRKAFERLDAEGRVGTVLVSQVTVAPGITQANNYLARTYTGLIPLIGHPHLTPSFERKQRSVTEWEETGVLNADIDTVDILIVVANDDKSLTWLSPDDWAHCFTVGNAIVLERKRL